MWYLNRPAGPPRRKPRPRPKDLPPAAPALPIPAPPVLADREPPADSDEPARGARSPLPGQDIPWPSHDRAPAPPVPVREVRPDPVRRLDEPRDAHRGRRADRRPGRDRSRQEREDGLLHMLAVFRVASCRLVVDRVFDGHPFAANRTIESLKRRGLVAQQKVSRGRFGYQVLMLTGHGRDLVAARVDAMGVPASTAGPQRYWSAGGDPRQLAHDQHVVEAVGADVADLVQRGGRVVRVRLESEIRGRLAAAEAAGRAAGGQEKARDARRAEARALGLRVFAGAVPLPDALVEIEDCDGRRLVHAVEVATGAYTSKQMAQKRSAGFHVFSVPGLADGSRRKSRARLPDEEFPLAWGGR